MIPPLPVQRETRSGASRECFHSGQGFPWSSQLLEIIQWTCRSAQLICSSAARARSRLSQRCRRKREPNRWMFPSKVTAYTTFLLPSLPSCSCNVAPSSARWRKVLFHCFSARCAAVCCRCSRCCCRKRASASRLCARCCRFFFVFWLTGLLIWWCWAKSACRFSPHLLQHPHSFFHAHQCIMRMTHGSLRACLKS